MPLIQLVVLALVQGITEFLPISSSAHLILAPLVVDGWNDQGPLIDVAAHVGTLGAVMLYFRGETASLFRGGIDTLRFRASDDRRLFLLIAGATIPFLLAAPIVVLTGLYDHLRSPVVIAWASIGFGALLWLADRAPARRTGVEAYDWRAALFVGAAQALALVPGTSRSGITMTAARQLGFERPEAARFSMLLSIPTIMALGAFAALKIVADGAEAEARDAVVMAALSFVAAFLTITAFMRLTARISFTPFVVYRIVLGVVLLLVFS